jgi:hypothetical protein
MNQKQLLQKKLRTAAFAAALPLGTSAAFAQVKIGDNPTTINSSAVLDLESTNKGFLPPRVTLQAVNDGATIANPATGLLVYNTNASAIDGVGIYINTGTPASPAWGKLEANTINTGGAANKMVYRGTTDPTRTVTGGILQFRFRLSGGTNLVEARLIKQPTQTISVIGQRIGWYGVVGGSASTIAINTSWSTADWDQWKQVDFMATATSHMYYLDVTGEEKFYRVSASIRYNDFNALLMETF